MADLLELLVKIKADNSDAVDKIDKTSSKANTAGQKIGQAFSTGAKVAGAALVAAGAAVGTLVAKSVQGYAEYEQLVGGVETLYGTSADKIMAYADQAYQTAGMSSNQYMETATSFAAALVICTLTAVSRGQKISLADIIFGCLVGIPNYYSARFLLLSLSYVPAVIAYPAFSTGTIVLVGAAGVLIFHEKMTRRQWTAVGMIIIAMVLLNSGG